MDTLSHLREAVKLSPDNVPLLTLLGNACITSWNFDEARQTFDTILKLSPQNSDALTGIAEISMKMGKTSEALVLLEMLDTSGSLSPRGMVIYSRIFLSRNDRDSAKRWYQKAVNSDPSLADQSYESELTGTAEPVLETPAEEPKITVSADSSDTDIDKMLMDIEKAHGPRRITFADVGGMESVKEEIRMKILYPLQNADLFKAYGKKSGGGVLLYGPPGCGKTLISRAVAGEINADFLSVGIHQILDMYLGNSEKQLHELFELARANKPSVLFIDEVDALAADRNHMKNSAGRTLINQLLSEMDGADSENDGMLITAATNAPWHIDPAFRRPGRFDRILFVPPPDAGARAAIYTILLKDKPMDGVDIEKLAQKSEGLSGADLSAVVDIASETVISRAMKQGKVLPLTMNDCLSALKKVKPSTKAWFETAKNYALFSNQGGFYDDVLTYMGIKK